nr:protein FAR1-RELATED SEQUENCE 5-like [Ipomoea batatas]
MARSDMEGDGASMETNDSGSEESGLQETECEMEISPDGTKLWIPNANPEETPYIGQKFQTVEEGVEFYKAYAKAVGFDVRHSTMRKTRTGEVAIKYMVCSREDQRNSNDEWTYKVQEKWGKVFEDTRQTNGGKIECTLNGWQEKMNVMQTTLQQLKKEFQQSNHQTDQSPANESAIESIVGLKTIGEINIKPPKVARNKGRGKRLKSNKEKAIEKSKKKQRACSTCGGRGHNSRTCVENNTYEED